jgi:hypothetical protein
MGRYEKSYFHDHHPSMLVTVASWQRHRPFAKVIGDVFPIGPCGRSLL